MADYQYTNVPGKLSEFLLKIRTIGVPAKATTQWLSSLGFKSKNDRSFLHILDFIGFTNNAGTPSDNWIKYRGRDYKTVLGNAIKASYSDLYEVYSDAHQRTNEELAHYFSTKNKSGEQVISRIVKTYKALVELASFDDSASVLQKDTKMSVTQTSESSETQAKKDAEFPHKPNIGSPSVHIDLQIHIAPEASPEQIDKIFESMAKHIFNK